MTGLSLPCDSGRHEDCAGQWDHRVMDGDTFPVECSCGCHRHRVDT